MAVGDVRDCTSWLSHTCTNTTFFTKSPTSFVTCFRGERQTTRNKVCLNRVSNSQPGHESDMPTTEPPERV